MKAYTDQAYEVGGQIHSGDTSRDIATGNRIDAPGYDTRALVDFQAVPAGHKAILLDAGSPRRPACWDIVPA